MDGLQRAHWSLDQLQLSTESLYEGKNSKVYSALDKATGVTVLLKWYEKARLSDLNRRQVDRELAIHRSLTHNNIVELLGTFEDKERVFLVEEFAEGGDLFYVVKTAPEGRLTEEQTRHMMVPLLLALSHLHSQGILHRDIKPENLVLTKDGVLKLADFGLAINLNEERPVTRLGTLDYMAPEVLHCPDKSCPAANKDREDLKYDCQVDVWATGVLAYELLAGSPPFEKSTRLETYSSIVNHSADDMVFPSFMPEGARDFIRAALHQDPAYRATAADLLCHPWLRPALPAVSPGQARRGGQQARDQSQAAASPPCTLGHEWGHLAAPGTAPALPAFSSAFMGAALDAIVPWPVEHEQIPEADEEDEDSRSHAATQPFFYSSNAYPTHDSAEQGWHHSGAALDVGMFGPTPSLEATVCRAKSSTCQSSVVRGSRSGPRSGGLEPLRRTKLAKSQQDLQRLLVSDVGSASSSGRGMGSRHAQQGSRIQVESKGESILQAGMHEEQAIPVGPGPARSASMPLEASIRLPPGFVIPSNRPPARGGNPMGNIAHEQTAVAWPAAPQAERSVWRSGPGVASSLALERFQDKSNSHESYVPVSWSTTSAYQANSLSSRSSAGTRAGHGLQAALPSHDSWASGNEPRPALAVSTRLPGPSPPPIIIPSSSSVSGPNAVSPAMGRRIRRQGSAEFGPAQPRPQPADAAQERSMQLHSGTGLASGLLPLGLAALLSPTADVEAFEEGPPSDRTALSSNAVMSASNAGASPSSGVRCSLSESGTGGKLPHSSDKGERPLGIFRRALQPVASEARAPVTPLAPAPPPSRRHFFTKLWPNPKAAVIKESPKESSSLLPQLKVPGQVSPPAVPRPEEQHRDNLRF